MIWCASKKCSGPVDMEFSYVFVGEGSPSGGEFWHLECYDVHDGCVPADEHQDCSEPDLDLYVLKEAVRESLETVLAEVQ